MEPHKLTKQNNTYIHYAIDRCQKLSEVLPLYEWNHCPVVISKPLSEKGIKKLEKKNNCIIPDDLRNFMTMRGLITIEKNSFNAGVSLSMLSTAFLNKTGMGLMNCLKALTDDATDYIEESDEFTEEQIDYLNSNYFVFAKFNPAGHEHYFLYFDRDGKFGSIYFEDGDIDMYPFQELLESSQAQSTFAELMCDWINEVSEIMINKADIDALDND